MLLKSIPLWGGLCLLFSVGAAQAQAPANTFAASTNHSASIKPDGSLWTWGINLEGQLGNGTMANSATPVRVMPETPNTNWAQVATGTSHTLALTTDGRLYAWGGNKDGQLGDGTTDGHTSPEAVLLPEGAAQATWKQIAAGTSHSLALSTDGRLYAWGYNNSGQLGTGYSSNRATPVEIPLPPSAANTSWALVSAGNNHTLALTADGRLYAWGSNLYGQLGDGSASNSLVPVAVGYTKKLAGLRWAHVTTGRFHTLAVTKDGRLYGWGSNRFGQLARDKVSQYNLPEPIPMPSRMAGMVWRQVAAGDAHSLALSEDGQLVGWGNNCAGQLGNAGSSLQLRPVAVAMPQSSSATTWTRIVSGGFHTLAYTTNGQLCMWGSNVFGQLGDGTTTDRSQPISQDPVLTALTQPVKQRLTSSSSAGTVEPWGLNDNRLMNEMPESPSFMMIPGPKDERRP